MRRAASHARRPLTAGRAYVTVAPVGAFPPPVRTGPVGSRSRAPPNHGADDAACPASCSSVPHRSALRPARPHRGVCDPASAAAPGLDDDDRLFVNRKSTTVEAAHHLKGRAKADAFRLARFLTAHWLTAGTPAEAPGTWTGW